MELLVSRLSSGIPTRSWLVAVYLFFTRNSLGILAKKTARLKYLFDTGYEDNEKKMAMLFCFKAYIEDENFFLAIM